MNSKEMQIIVLNIKPDLLSRFTRGVGILLPKIYYSISLACGSPQWANDIWCDDQNNNAACNYDGGACCNNTFSGWNVFCNACQCLDPNPPAGGKQLISAG